MTKYGKRNIAISFEQAKEWYNSENTALREIALQAYTKEELTEPQTFEEICKRLNISVDIEVKSLNYTDKAFEKDMRLSLLLIRMKVVARYFNRGRVPESGKEKYFICRERETMGPYISLGKGFCVMSPMGPVYPGVVYFMEQKDAVKAFKMLQNEIEELL